MFRVDLARRNGICAVAVICLCLAGGRVAAAPPASPSPSPQRTVSPVSAQEKAAVKAAIEVFYQAWVGRDLERIISLERLAIDASAEDYEKRGKGKAEDVRESFRGATKDVLDSKDFKMKPLHLVDVEFRREGELIVVASAIPIIATESVSVDMGDGTSQRVRILISKIVFRKAANGYEIVKMNLHG